MRAGCSVCPLSLLLPLVISLCAISHLLLFFFSSFSLSICVFFSSRLFVCSTHIPIPITPSRDDDRQSSHPRIILTHTSLLYRHTRASTRRRMFPAADSGLVLPSSRAHSTCRHSATDASDEHHRIWAARARQDDTRVGCVDSTSLSFRLHRSFFTTMWCTR